MKDIIQISNFEREKFYFFDDNLNKWSDCEVLNQDPFEDILEIVKIKDNNGCITNKFLKLVNSINDFSKDGCVYKVKFA